ncbi:Arm DNA-binding domain-containing protein [Tissierella sp.]
MQFIISYKDNTGKWKQKSKQDFKKKSNIKKVVYMFLNIDQKSI